MEIVLVVAMSENRVIGRDGDLPWKISADLKHFKKVTMGYPVVMGRKTWESLPFPLPGRRNIVITRNPDAVFDGAETVATIAGALDLCRDDGADKAMIIGGGQIFADILRDADVIELTEVHADIDGDTVFPALEEGVWEESFRERHPAETPDGPEYSFVTLQRR
jgi:dihydrofolate reductase